MGSFHTWLYKTKSLRISWWKKFNKNWGGNKEKMENAEKEENSGTVRKNRVEHFWRQPVLLEQFLLSPDDLWGQHTHTCSLCHAELLYTWWKCLDICICVTCLEGFYYSCVLSFFVNFTTNMTISYNMMQLFVSFFPSLNNKFFERVYKFFEGQSARRVMFPVTGVTTLEWSVFSIPIDGLTIQGQKCIGTTSRPISRWARFPEWEGTNGSLRNLYSILAE